METGRAVTPSSRGTKKVRFLRHPLPTGGEADDQTQTQPTAKTHLRVGGVNWQHPGLLIRRVQVQILVDPSGGKALMAMHRALTPDNQVRFLVPSLK